MTIRRQPTDFDVRERLTPAFASSIQPARSATSTFAIYRLRKTSLTTPEAIGYMARDLGLKPADIDYAGLKDKHAVTTQVVSILTRKPDTRPPAQVTGTGWEATFLGWAATHCSAECIDGNDFTLVVSDLTREAAAEMDRRARLLQHEPGTLLLVNYFGDQRFGSARHGQGWAARLLMKGDFEGALKLLIGTPARKEVGKMRTFTRMVASHWGQWSQLVDQLPRVPELRVIQSLATTPDFRKAFAQLPPFLQSMVVEAFQSHLWNQTAVAMMDSLGEPLLRTQGLFGENVFPPCRRIPSDWIDVLMPVLAKSSQLACPWGDAAARVLASEGITLTDLQIPGVKRPFFGEALRPLFCRAGGFAMSAASPDPERKGRMMRTVEFQLPRGAYATIVLRALGQ
jgi:tRNA pseudouridine13 synthase